MPKESAISEEAILEKESLLEELPWMLITQKWAINKHQTTIFNYLLIPSTFFLFLKLNLENLVNLQTKLEIFLRQNNIKVSANNMHNCNGGTSFLNIYNLFDFLTSPDIKIKTLNFKEIRDNESLYFLWNNSCNVNMLDILERMLLKINVIISNENEYSRYHIEYENKDYELINKFLKHINNITYHRICVLKQ